MKNKRFTHYTLLILGVLSGMIAIGLIIQLVRQYGPQKPIQVLENETLSRFQVDTRTPQSPSPTPEVNAQSGTPTPESSPTITPTPTPDWMTYESIDFKDKEVEALFTMACSEDSVYLPPFPVVPYRPDIIESGLFYAAMDFVIAWEHLGYYGLWIHSGRSLTSGELAAFPLQLYLENDDRGYRRSPIDFDNHLHECFVGSEMRLRQDDTLSVSKIVAAVRIPPNEVETVSQHVMDLVPYLAENYPESGFDQMNVPGIIFNFCGRQLTGEALNPNLDYWAQSRTIFGAVPIDSSP